jgi:hypothetical protein
VDGSGSLGGSDVPVQPLSERGGGPKNLGNPAFGRRRGEPCTHRPLLPGGEALVSEELDSRVVTGVTPWRRLEGLPGGHLNACSPEVFHQSDELPTPSIIGNRSPKARELTRRWHVQARTDSECIGGKGDVARVVVGSDIDLVRRLVRTESSVTIRAKDTTSPNSGANSATRACMGPRTLAE